MNRPRREDECYQCYRRHLKEEEAELQKKLQPRIIWTASMIVPNAKEKDLPPYLRSLVKVQVRGTFNRFLGHRMPNSLYEQHKRERMLNKLKRKGVIKDAS